MFGVKSRQQEGDPRIAQALRELEIKFEVGDDGDYAFGFDLGDGRSQMGFIRSGTYEFCGIELREILSAGLRSMGPFDARTCNLLLRQNSDVKVGSWSVVKDDEDNHLAIFSAKVSADLSGEALLGVIVGVLKTADEMEARLAGRDDF